MPMPPMFVPIREVERRMEGRPGLGYIQARNEILLERAARERPVF